MTFLVRLFPMLLICVTATVSTAQDNRDDLDALLRRLDALEAEQAKAQETIKTLRSEIEALRAETEALRTQTEDDQLTEQRAEEIPAPESDVPADAGGQARPPTTPLAIHGVFPELADESQFVFRSADGNFSLGIDGTIIGRYEVNRRKKDRRRSSDTDQGFEMTGTRINFKGELYNDFGYWVRINADDFGDPIIDAALGYYKFNDDTTIVAGQFPSLLTREQGIPVDKLQVSESSPTNYTFDPFGFKGVMLGYHTPRMVYRAIINDGYRSFNNAFFDEPSAKWAFGGQVSGLVVGDKSDWERFNNFTSRRGSDFAWLLNGAFLVQEGDSHGSGGEGSDDLFLGVVESSMEGDGWNLYASGYFRHTELDFIDADDFGFVLQGGAWVSEHYELYSRFDITIPDSDRWIEDDEFKTITAGVNYYPIPHSDNLKLSLEALYMFDAEATSIVEPNVFSSVRESGAGDQIVFRSSVMIRF